MPVPGVSSAGAGTIYAFVTSDPLARMPPGSVSLADGVLCGAQSVALILVNSLIGRAVDRLHNYDAIGVALGLWVLPGSLARIVWRPALRFARSAEALISPV